MGRVREKTTEEMKCQIYILLFIIGKFTKITAIHTHLTKMTIVNNLLKNDQLKNFRTKLPRDHFKYMVSVL